MLDNSDKFKPNDYRSRWACQVTLISRDKDRHVDGIQTVLSLRRGTYQEVTDGAVGAAVRLYPGYELFSKAATD